LLPRLPSLLLLLLLLSSPELTSLLLLLPDRKLAWTTVKWLSMMGQVMSGFCVSASPRALAAGCHKGENLQAWWTARKHSSMPVSTPVAFHEAKQVTGLVAGYLRLGEPNLLYVLLHGCLHEDWLSQSVNPCRSTTSKVRL
jgi:hypothetical protein